MLGTYRDVLDRPGALAFSGAGVIARLPMSMVGIGIILMIESLHGSYRLAGAVSAAYVLAQAVCSPQLARLVDQHGQARVMRPALTVSAVALVALVLCASLDAPVWTLYATAVLVGATIGSFGALVRARWSHVLSDPRALHTAYSLESALDELVFVVGPILATTLATAVAPSAGLVVPVVGMVLGGYWFLAQRRTEPPPHGPRPAGPDGVPARRVSVMRSGGMVVLAVVFVAMGSIFGATDVSTVAFAEEAGRQALAGVVLAVFACGSMISGLLYGARHWVTPLWRRFAIGMVALAVGVSLFVLVSSMTMLAVVMFVVGFAIAPTLVNGNGLVQHFVARERLTEGLTWVGTSLGVGVSLGSWVAGSMIDRQGSHGGYLVVVGSAALAVVAVLASLRTLRAGNPDALVPATPADDSPAGGGAAPDAGSSGGGEVNRGVIGAGSATGAVTATGAVPATGADSPTGAARASGTGSATGAGSPTGAVPDTDPRAGAGAGPSAGTTHHRGTVPDPDRSPPTTLPVPMDVPGTERLAPVADDTPAG